MFEIELIDFLQVELEKVLLIKRPLFCNSYMLIRLIEYFISSQSLCFRTLRTQYRQSPRDGRLRGKGESPRRETLRKRKLCANNNTENQSFFLFARSNWFCDSLVYVPCQPSNNHPPFSFNHISV